MRSTLAVFTNECTLFIRNRLQVWGVLLFLAIGLYSIRYGHAEMSKENTRRQLLEDSIQHARAARAALLQSDTLQPAGRFAWETAALPSLVRFNYQFLTARRPAPMAALSLGQLDVTPAYYLLNAQSLYVQTLKGDIANPFKLKAGNFDLAFVLVYLLPLLIIALCFDVLSAEKEAGVLPLLRMNRYPLSRLVLVKMLFRMLVGGALVAGLSLAAFTAGHVTLFSVPAALWLLVACCYTLFWYAVLLLIISFNGTSALNAMVSLGVWVLLLVVVPVTLQAQAGLKGPSPLSLSTLMRSRNMEESDVAMQQALNRFYRYYPQLKPAGSIQSPFYQFQGYSAFLYDTDREADRQMAAYHQAIRAGADHTGSWLLLSPAANTLLLLNHVAGTDLPASLAFKEQVAAFHRQQLFWFANRPLFENRYMTAEDYAHAPAFKPTAMPVQSTLVAGRILLLLLPAAGCVLAALFQLQEKKQQHD